MRTEDICLSFVRFLGADFPHTSPMSHPHPTGAHRDFAISITHQSIGIFFEEKKALCFVEQGRTFKECNSCSRRVKNETLKSFMCHWIEFSALAAKFFA